MFQSIRIAAVVVSAVALAACGQGAKLGGGKQGAAQAVFQASQASRGASSSGGLLQLIQDRGVNASVTVNGDAGGTATISADVSAVPSATSVSVNIAYSNYSEDGKDFYNGTLSVVVNISGSGTGLTGYTGTVQVQLIGKLSISGAIDDFVDSNITETVAFGSLQGGATGVSVTLNGSIATSTSQYQYANENVTVSSSDALPAATASTN